MSIGATAGEVDGWREEQQEWEGREGHMIASRLLDDSRWKAKAKQSCGGVRLQGPSSLILLWRRMPSTRLPGDLVFPASYHSRDLVSLTHSLPTTNRRQTPCERCIICRRRDESLGCLREARDASPAASRAAAERLLLPLSHCSLRST